MENRSEPPRRDDAYLRDLWNLVQRNRFLTLGIPVLAVVATAVLVLILPPVYEGETLIRIEEERTMIAMPDILEQFTKGSRIQTEMAVLRTRILAEEVVDSLDLHVAIKPVRTPRRVLFSHLAARRDARPAVYRLDRTADGRAFRLRGGGPDRAPAAYGVGETIRLPGLELVLAEAALEHGRITVEVMDFREAVVDFQETVQIGRPDRDAEIVAIAYEAHDSLLVQQVPELMARRFIHSRHRAQTSEARATVTFLSQQIDTVGRQLRNVEDELLRFQARTGIIHAEEEARTAVERLAELHAERDRVDSERSALVRILGRGNGATPEAARRLMYFPTLLRNAAASDVMLSITDIENRRAQLLERRTPDDPDVQALTARLDDLEDQLLHFAVTYVQGLESQVQSLDGTLARFRGVLESVPPQAIQLARLERELKILEEAYIHLETRRQQTEVTAAVRDQTVRVVDPAVVPGEPVRPRRTLSVLLAGVLGLVVGFSAAFAREHLDTRIRSRNDLLVASRDAPILGTIPRIRAAATNGRFARVNGSGGADRQERLVTDNDPQNPVAEAYRALRTNLTFSSLERPPRTLVVTSAMPGEGKSTCAANLAITLAQQGRTALLIDADLRRGGLHDVLDVARGPGLSELLLGRAGLDEVIQSVELDGARRLAFVPAGSYPPNPSELLGSDGMERLLREMEERFDLVVLDAPPLDLVTDAALLGVAADGVVVVARSGVTSREALGHAVAQLESVRATVLGTVLNDVDVKKERYYGGAYAGAGYYGR